MFIFIPGPTGLRFIHQRFHDHVPRPEHIAADRVPNGDHQKKIPVVGVAARELARGQHANFSGPVPEAKRGDVAR